MFRHLNASSRKLNITRNRKVFCNHRNDGDDHGHGHGHNRHNCRNRRNRRKDVRSRNHRRERIQAKIRAQIGV